jgi:hypothetical protein
MLLCRQYAATRLLLVALTILALWAAPASANCGANGQQPCFTFNSCGGNGDKFALTVSCLLPSTSVFVSSGSRQALFASRVAHTVYLALHCAPHTMRIHSRALLRHSLANPVTI